MKSHQIKLGLSAALLTALATFTASAQTSTWDGGGSPTNTWSTLANWAGDVAPVAGDALVFGGTVNRSTSNDFAANTAFTGIALNTAGWTLAGNAINFAGTVAQNNVSGSSSDNAISLSLNLTGATEFAAVASSTRLTFTGAITGSGAVTKTGSGTSRWNSAANTNSFSGGLTVSAGTIDLLGNFNVPYGAGKGDVTINSGATIFINNTNQTFNGLNGAGNITRAGTNTRTLSIGDNNANGTFTGSITNTGGSSSVTKIGTGKQVVGNITAPNLNINGGTLVANGTVAATTTVGTSGTLSGIGTLNLAATVNGGLRPNEAPTNNTSRLTFANNLTLASSSITTFDINGNNYTGVTLTTAETLTFGGGLGIVFTNSINPGVYDLLNFTDTNTGNFASVEIKQGVTPTSIGALTLSSGVWSGTYSGVEYSFSQSTGDLTVSVIPEPSTWAALAGMIGLGFAATRRRRSR